MVSAAAAAASAPLVHSGFLFKRGKYYTWNSKEFKLYSDGTMTIATSGNQLKIKHVIVVKRATAVVEVHTKSGTRGWRYEQRA